MNPNFLLECRISNYLNFYSQELKRELKKVNEELKEHPDFLSAVRYKETLEQQLSSLLADLKKIDNGDISITYVASIND